MSYFDVCCVCSRPDSTFTWFMNPFKSLKYMLWNNYKMCLIKFLVIGLLVALMGLFFYSMPVRTPFRYVAHQMSLSIYFLFVPISIRWEKFFYLEELSWLYFCCLSRLHEAILDISRVSYRKSASAPLFSPLPVVSVDTKKMCTSDLPSTHRFIKTGCWVTVGLGHLVVSSFALLRCYRF